MGSRGSLCDRTPCSEEDTALLPGACPCLTTCGLLPAPGNRVTDISFEGQMGPDMFLTVHDNWRARVQTMDRNCDLQVEITCCERDRGPEAEEEARAKRDNHGRGG